MKKNLFKIRSLKLKILLPVIALTVLGFAALALISVMIAQGIINENIRSISSAKADKVASFAETKLDVWKSEMELLATADVVQSLNYPAFEEYINSRPEVFDGYELIALCDTSGAYHDSTGKQGSVADREYIKQALQGKINVSDPVISRATNHPVIAISAPVKDKSGNIKGVVFGTLPLSYISDVIASEKYGKTGYAFMIGKDGLIFAHPIADKVYKENLAKNSSPSMVAIIQKMMNGETGTDFYSYEGIYKIAGYTTVKSTGWPVAMTIEYSEVSGGITQLRNTSIVVAIVVIAFILIIVFITINRSLKPVNMMVDATNKVADGDLTIKIDCSSKDEIGVLSDNFNQMVFKMRGLISDMNDMGATVASASEELMSSSEEVCKASEQVAIAVTDLATNATEQAISTSDSSKQIMQILDGLNSIAEDMSTSNVLSLKAMDAMNSGKELVQFQEEKMSESKQISQKVVSSIRELYQKSKEIGEIIEVIRQIAAQTNLLSLNAAIEAARAGEHGKGFSIVADEVRKLAEQSGNSVKRISEIIKEVQFGINNAVDEINLSDSALLQQEKALGESIKAFSDISSSVTQISENIKSVHTETKSLSKNATVAGEVVNKITGFSQDIASSSEEIAASSEEQTSIMHQVAESSENLAKMAGKLQDNLKNFKV